MHDQKIKVSLGECRYIPEDKLYIFKIANGDSSSGYVHINQWGKPLVIRDTWFEVTPEEEEFLKEQAKAFYKHIKEGKPIV